MPRPWRSGGLRQNGEMAGCLAISCIFHTMKRHLLTLLAVIQIPIRLQNWVSNCHFLLIFICSFEFVIGSCHLGVACWSVWCLSVSLFIHLCYLLLYHSLMEEINSINSFCDGATLQGCELLLHKLEVGRMLAIFILKYFVTKWQKVVGVFACVIIGCKWLNDVLCVMH